MISETLSQLRSTSGWVQCDKILANSCWALRGLVLVSSYNHSISRNSISLSLKEFLHMTDNHCFFYRQRTLSTLINDAFTITTDTMMWCWPYMAAKFSETIDLHWWLSNGPCISYERFSSQLSQMLNPLSLAQRITARGSYTTDRRLQQWWDVQQLVHSLVQKWQFSVA